MKPVHLVVLLAGCHTDWGASTVDGWRLLEGSFETGTSGGLTVDIEVQPGESAMLLAAVVPEKRLVYVAGVRQQGVGRIYVASAWWDAERNHTNAGFSSSATALNWPVDADDAPLSPGWWRVDLQTDKPSVAADLTVMLKSDADFARGALAVDVWITADLTGEAELLRGVDAAIARWRDEIYAPMGIELIATVRQAPGTPSTLAAPGVGDAEHYEALAAEAAPGTVNLVIASRIADGIDTLGIAGGVPGPLAVSRNAAVVVSAVGHAGRDRLFVDEEIALFSETMAHEVGHYMGLFHPIELPVGAEPISAWDDLDDTPECETFDDCLPSLGANLMFPTPVCEEEIGANCITFVSQRVVTPDQISLAQRYTGVREP